MKAANYRFLSPWAVTVVEDGTSIDDQPLPGPEQYFLTPLDGDNSLLGRNTRSFNSFERDESLEAREGQLHADNMAQHLV